MAHFKKVPFLGTYVPVSVFEAFNVSKSFSTSDICGQSYKHFMLVNYDSSVVPDWKIPHITTLES